MARTQTVTIMFCDLVASTERRAQLGDDAFDEFAGRFLAALRHEISEAQGRELSNAGDGLMVVFAESAADAVACATAMHRAVAVLDPIDPPQAVIVAHHAPGGARPKQVSGSGRNRRFLQNYAL